MKTRNMVYYVGLVEGDLDAPDPDSGIGTALGQTWGDTIRSALMPGCVTPTTSLAAIKSMPSSGYHGGTRNCFKNFSITAQVYKKFCLLISQDFCDILQKLFNLIWCQN